MKFQAPEEEEVKEDVKEEEGEGEGEGEGEEEAASDKEKEPKTEEKKPAEKEEKKDIINKMFRIPGKLNYVVTLATDKSQVSIYDVISMQPVRTLNGVTQPRRLEVSILYKKTNLHNYFSFVCLTLSVQN